MKAARLRFASVCLTCVVFWGNSAQSPARAGEREAAKASPPACHPETLSAAQRKRYDEDRQKLRQAIQETKELSNGYAFRLPADAATCMAAAEFMALEHTCCSFFRFELVLESDSTALWLRLTGREGVKEFLKEHLGRLP